MTTETPIALTLGIADPNEYGNNFNDATDEDGIVSFAFDATEGDLELTLSGFDIDFNDEVEVLLNGQAFGFLTSGPNLDLEAQSFLIAAADMVEGQNIISFVQTMDTTFAWGVTNVKIDAAVPEEEEPAVDTPVADLALGVTDAGIYGNRYEDALDEDGLVSFTFTSTGDDLVLSYDGFDIDQDGEVEVYLNGALIGSMTKGPNDGLTSQSLEIADADLLSGENVVTFKQATNPNFVWGVTNVKIDAVAPEEEAPADVPVADLALGVTDAGIYGNRFGEAVDEDGLVSFTFSSTGDDLVLSYDGFDIDKDGEVEVYLNGALIGSMTKGPNDGLTSQSLEIADADLLSGENVVTFKQATNPNFVWGVTNVKIDAVAPEEEAPADVPVADLSLGVTDAGIYGNRFGEAVDEDGLVSFTFSSTGDDLVLSYDGFDIDKDGEVEVYLNGALIGSMTKGPNDGLTSQSLEIADADLLSGENVVTFKQATNPNFVWGVTNVKIDAVAPEEEAPADVPVADLSLGVTDAGIYGNRFGEAVDEDGLVSFTFSSTGDDLVLSYDGFDIDKDGEVEVYLNGALIGSMTKGPNDGLTSQSLEIADADLLSGENVVTFAQATNPNFVWGVTNVKIATAEPEVVEVPVDIPVANLALGVTDAGIYGNRYEGETDEDGLISFTFDATGNDISIDVDGFDIDQDGEVEVYLNDALVGEMSAGDNNGLIAHTFVFEDAALLSGQNTVTFKQATNVNYVWGVTNVTATEVPNTVGTLGDDRIVGGEGNDSLFGDDGNDIFVFFQGGAQDVITDFTLADDVIQLQNFGLTEFSQLTIETDVDLNAVVALSETDTLTLTGIDAVDLNASHFDFV